MNKLLEKFKNINFKKFSRGFAIIWMLIFIVVMTITNVSIDEHFNWLKWLGSAMILFGIAVFGLFIGESIGVDYSKEKVGGLYQKNLFKYNSFRDSIDGIILYFPMFYDWFVPQRLESKQINFLIMNDVNPKQAKKIVKYCTLEDLFTLKNEIVKKEINGEEILIDKLQEHEIEPVEEVLRGHVKLKLSGCSYYLQAFAESNQKDILEQGEAYKEARKYNKNSNRAIRLISGAAISLALGILTVNDFANAGNAQAWMNLVTRMANLFTALFSGWLSGINDVKLESDSIENKTNVLKLFSSAYDKKLFELYDEEEKIKKEFEKQEENKKEAIKSVVESDDIKNNYLISDKNILLLNQDKEE